ncbi:hypothetical protein L1887_16242 [Cichorium endivia]|nr:hypothetical protein L1887_16242 [Cichorium endivia]
MPCLAPQTKKRKKKPLFIDLTSAIYTSVLVFSLNHHSSILKIESFFSTEGSRSTVRFPRGVMVGFLRLQGES